MGWLPEPFFSWSIGIFAAQRRVLESVSFVGQITIFGREEDSWTVKFTKILIVFGSKTSFIDSLIWMDKKIMNHLIW